MDRLENDHDDEHQERRPLGLVLIGGLYLFFLILTISTFGQPYPLMGSIYQGRAAEAVVLVDSLICLYLFLGLMKRQQLTWYLLIGYNGFELVNTAVNLAYITVEELEKAVGQPVDPHQLVSSNLSVIVAILLLSVFIYRHRPYFTNRSNYLF